jgi:TrmH family RNA methyltransferase
MFAVSTVDKSRLRRVNSPQNGLLKEMRRAFHQGELTGDGHAAIESVRVVDEAIRAGLRFKAVVFRESAGGVIERMLPQISAHAEAIVVPDKVFEGVVATESPQGVAALVKVRESKIEDVVAGDPALVVVAAGLQDPGNLGTVIRSAEAFGATGVVLASKTVSVWNPKVVRASAGSIFRLPQVAMTDADAVKELKARGVRLLGTSSHKGTAIWEVDWTAPVAVFIGNEGAGLSREISAALEEMVGIPHAEKVESLNAGIAASVVLYEAARQRGSSHRRSGDAEG